ncbi:hypothetical protein [Leptolyngbya iicbica]|uniref:Uncharacterized protein n=2 Tax=Cyanophyceae TaxID=3028117 RepID=A0A4Q7EFY8_9CYAN|nr:hypothetical protein [Leptolyngbya sp. LK]RZM81858.1 hypothetical protein DYY88_00860 [Leptolyngbya sp. LK]
MSVAAFTATNDYEIRYEIQPWAGQIRLRLWEPAVTIERPTEQVQPYLYLANFSFGTVAEAEAYLRNHLLSNGAFDVPESNFPSAGAVAILPYPTWGTDAVESPPQLDG